MKFTASRLSSDNKIFPSEIYLESTGITIKIPGLFSGETKHFDFNHIASVEIDTPLIGFSTITIFAGGTKMSANGFTKAEVKQIKEGIEAGKKASTNQSNVGQTSIADEIQKPELAQVFRRMTCVYDEASFLTGETTIIKAQPQSYPS